MEITGLVDFIKLGLQGRNISVIDGRTTSTGEPLTLYGQVFLSNDEKPMIEAICKLNPVVVSGINVVPHFYSEKVKYRLMFFAHVAPSIELK